MENKTYVVKVGTRNRITIPWNCCVDFKISRLALRYPDGMECWWDPLVGMTKDLSFRVAVPFKRGTKLELSKYVNAKHKRLIQVSKVR